MRIHGLVGRVLALAAVCAAVIISMAAAGVAEGPPRAVILVDGSASMTGFFAKPDFREATRSLANTLRAQGYGVEAIVYRTKSDGAADDDVVGGEGLGELSDAKVANGQLTFTDRALGKVLKRGSAEAVWIVTDNVVDTGGSRPDRDIEAYYKRLRGPGVESVDLFPMKLPFSGDLKDREGNRTGFDYRGNRGLIVYGILPSGLGESAKKRYDSAVEGLQRTGGRFADHLRARPLLAPRDVELELVPVAPSGVSGNAVALKLVGARAADGSYHFAFPESFKPNQAIEGVFGLRLKGDTGPVVLDGVKVNVTMPRKFEGGDYASADWKAVSKPETVTLGGLAPNSTQVLVTVKIPGGIDFKPSVSTSMKKFKSYWDLGVSGETSATLQSDVVVTLVAPGQEAKLDRAFISAWSVEPKSYFNDLKNPNVQSRILNFDQLFADAKTNESSVPTTKKGVAAVDLDLLYPALLGAAAVLGPLLALLVSAAGIGAYLVWRKSAVVARSVNGEWIIGPVPKASSAPPSEWADPSGLGGAGEAASGRQSRSRLAAMTRGIPLSDEGQLYGWLKWVPFSGWVAMPAAGYVLTGGQRQARLGPSLSSHTRVGIEPVAQTAPIGLGPSVDWSPDSAASVVGEWAPDEQAARVTTQLPPVGSPSSVAANSPNSNGAPSAPPKEQPSAPSPPDSPGSSDTGSSGSFISW